MAQALPIPFAREFHVQLGSDRGKVQSMIDVQHGSHGLTAPNREGSTHLLQQSARFQ